MGKTFCNFCGDELEPSQEFIYQFETQQFLEDYGISEEELEYINSMTTYEGEPLRLCKKCNESAEKNVSSLKQDFDDQPRLDRINTIILTTGILLILLIIAILKWTK